MTVQSEMPRYRCHKEVWALKIKTIELLPSGDAVITPEEAGYAPIEVMADYVSRHRPRVGGYYVVYSDGHQSWSPGPAFEEGYTRIR